MSVKKSNMDKGKIDVLRKKEYENEDCKDWEGDYEWISKMK